VDGFWDLAQALRDRQPDMSLYYPSSIAVGERPEGMTEYAMAKAAGETLCADMNVSLAPLHVTQSRLPRLPTDQTASVADVATAGALETLLPIIREVQSWGAGRSGMSLHRLAQVVQPGGHDRQVIQDSPTALDDAQLEDSLTNSIETHT
jgi:hypothetical protein